MKRETREELKRLSEKLLGKSSRWQKFLDTTIDTGEVIGGKPVKRVVLRTPEQVLEELKKIEHEIAAQEAAAKVEEYATGRV